MAAKYQVGDKFIKIRQPSKGWEITIIQVLGTSYKVEAKQHHKPYFKTFLAMEDAKSYTLVGGPSFVASQHMPAAINAVGTVTVPAGVKIQLPDIDVDGTIENLRKQWAQAIEKSHCDCGARKCGYRDDEFHAHARWCDVHKKVFRTPIIEDEV